MISHQCVSVVVKFISSLLNVSLLLLIRTKFLVELLCVGLPSHKKLQFLQPFFNFSSADAEIVPTF